MRILEMAKDRKSAIRYIEDKTDTRDLHIMKLFFWRDDEAFLHWCKEIAHASYSPQVKVGGKLGFLKYETILNCVRDQWMEGRTRRWFDAGISDLVYCDGYLEPDYAYSFENAYNFLWDMQTWVAKQMSVQERLDGRQVEAEARQLLKRYSVN